MSLLLHVSQIFSDRILTSTHASFIVLEHDLFESEVDLSVGYFLDAALSHNPPFKVGSARSRLYTTSGFRC